MACLDRRIFLGVEWQGNEYYQGNGEQGSNAAIHIQWAQAPPLLNILIGPAVVRRQF